MTLGPIPQHGLSGMVRVHGIELMLDPGSWVCGEGEQFAPQQAQGAVQYVDFNPHRQPWEIAGLDGGYGLKRVSDKPQGDAMRRKMYHEAHNISCRDGGLITLSDELQVSATALSGTPLWIGEFTPSSGSLSGSPQVVVVTDDGKIWTVNSDFTLSLQCVLPSAPRRNAIGEFSGNLIIGYGATRTAQYTTNLTTLADVINATPAAIYIWAFTSDRAAAYVAGGATTADGNDVVSSTTGINAYSIGANIITCGTSESFITALAPGGGLALLFIGKETELGEIDNSGVYRQLVPFDSKLSTNCRLLRWYLATTADEQRGPVVLFFSRERGLWSYQPQTDAAGTAKNMSPWAAQGIHPDNVRGIPTALQGTARWLYYTITNSDTGKYYLLAQDARTGAIHGSLADLETNECQAMTVSALLGGGPRLYLGYGDRLATIILPLDGDSPLDNPACRYVSEGYIDFSEIDYDFPDEMKILFSIRIIADDLSPAVRYVEVYTSEDGGAFTLIGSVANSPATVLIPNTPTVRRVGVRLKLYSDSRLETPRVRAAVLRGSINPDLYRSWTFSATTPAGSLSSQWDDLQNPYGSITTLWAARRAGTPIEFVDRWRQTWEARIVQMQEMEIIREPDRPPETLISLRLIEVAATLSGDARYDDGSGIYDEVTVGYGS